MKYIITSNQIKKLLAYYWYPSKKYLYLMLMDFPIQILDCFKYNITCNQIGKYNIKHV